MNSLLSSTNSRFLKELHAVKPRWRQLPYNGWVGSCYMEGKNGKGVRVGADRVHVFECIPNIQMMYLNRFSLYTNLFMAIEMRSRKLGVIDNHLWIPLSKHFGNCDFIGLHQVIGAKCYLKKERKKGHFRLHQLGLTNEITFLEVNPFGKDFSICMNQGTLTSKGQRGVVLVFGYDPDRENVPKDSEFKVKHNAGTTKVMFRDISQETDYEDRKRDQERLFLKKKATEQKVMEQLKADREQYKADREQEKREKKKRLGNRNRENKKKESEYGSDEDDDITMKILEKGKDEYWGHFR